MNNFILSIIIMFCSFSLFSQEILLLSDSDEPNQEYSYLTNELITSENIITPIWTANCWCRISYEDLTNKTSSQGVALDLTKRVNKKYTGTRPQKPANRNDCSTRCTKKAANLSQSELNSIAQKACSANKRSGTLIRAFSAVGKRAYNTAHYIGKLENKPAQTKTDCNCPSGWTVDNNQSDPKRKCSKALCNLERSVSNRELPQMPGFIWDNTIYQWTSAKCVTTQISAGTCRLVR